jgi:hypothetical protein
MMEGEGCLVGRLDDEYSFEQAIWDLLVTCSGKLRLTYGRELSAQRSSTGIIYGDSAIR